jgi:formylglycine-generating enzyme required for sulfatase activity
MLYLALGWLVALTGGRLLWAQAPGEFVGTDGAPMILVPGGEFIFGEGDTRRRLTLPPFFMDKYEVTTKRYRAFQQATGRKEPFKPNELIQPSDADKPIIGVDWSEAEAYCRHYGRRLPTEEEWEKAARGTDERIYPWGNQEPSHDLAGYDWDNKQRWQGYDALSRVGAFETGKSPYGVLDMAGGVIEWTGSNFDRETKVVRGGSWLSHPSALKSAYRRGVMPSYRLNSLGFRCLAEAAP